VGWVANDGSYVHEEAGIGWFPSEKVRLFPNDRRIHFENKVHEFVEPSLSRYGIEIKKSNIPIHHYGKLNQEKTFSKWKEYHELGKIKLSDKGEKDVMALFELAVQAAELKRYEEAAEYWQKAIAVKSDFFPAFYGMGNIFFNQCRYEEALSWYRKALQLNSNIREAVVMCSTCELFVGSAEASINLLEDLLTKETIPTAMFPLAAAYFCLDRKENGFEIVKKLKDMNWSCAHYFSQVARVLIKTGRCNYAILLLKAAIESNSVTDETSVLLSDCYKMLGEGMNVKT
jgi:tetratricopeptide (TPR) repeat protein